MSRGKLYKDSGVDIEKGDALASWLSSQSDEKHDTKLGSVVSGIGGFAGLYRPNFAGFKDPVLVSGTDGVGTKVLLGLQEDKLSGLGIDLVAMCVNDLYTIGGKPMFFLDYYATGVLDDAQFKQVLTGIRQGLGQCGAVLLGGETAELPGLYEKGHFDLAGFVVGAVDFEKRISGESVRAGDVLLSFQSSGFHSNGFSLVRRMLDKIGGVDSDLMTKIMEPTKIYGEVPGWLEDIGVENCHALSNITGGGISGNLPRVLPSDVKGVIHRDKLPTQTWMRDLLEKAGVSFEDAEPVFNLGAGMVASVEQSKVADIVDAAARRSLEPVVIGHIEAHEGEPIVEYI